MIKAVCFDLWNTLRYCPTREKVNAAIKLLGLEGKTSYENVMEYAGQTLLVNSGFTGGKFFKSLCEKHGVDCSENAVRDAVEVWESRLENTRLFRETADVIEKLAVGYKLGLISNTDLSGARYMREEHGDFIMEFDVVLFSCEVGLAKPDGRIFKLAVEKLKTTPEETIMVGDNPRADVEAPIKYGMHAILIDRKDSYGDIPYKKVRSLYEMEDVIKKIK